ncbi:hypothetical protein GQ55_6G209200 [Panicum hallii var. hallii]|uniref:Uncharacterized protein n=1 Tax=Panicum hallii var. hallii TaxID=1504633 RepID=A0A2T7D801_9POAL|nr:hypothetical protein GQ55_6G209200 [Panicum hallii var. hallii]
MASRALAAAAHLACAFGAALYWAAGPAGHTTTALPCGDVHASAAAAAPLLLLLVATTYFLTVALVYLELAVAANPGLVAARRLATATASAAAVTSLLALSASVYGGLRPNEI